MCCRHEIHTLGIKLLTSLDESVLSFNPNYRRRLDHSFA